MQRLPHVWFEYHGLRAADSEWARGGTNAGDILYHTNRISTLPNTQLARLDPPPSSARRAKR